MSIRVQGPVVGVRGGPRALQGISVDTRLSRQLSILSNEGFEIAMPRARKKLHPLWYDSDTLEGRAGYGGTFARKGWQQQWPSPFGTAKGSP